MNETRLSTKRMNTKSSHPTKTSNHPQKRNAQTPKRLKNKTTESPVCFVGVFHHGKTHRNPHLKSIRPTPCTPFHGTLQLIEGKSHQTGEPWLNVLEVLCVLIKKAVAFFVVVVLMGDLLFFLKSELRVRGWRFGGFLGESLKNSVSIL